MKKPINQVNTFLFGGAAYCLLEILWRRRTHPSMFCAGGLALSVLRNLFKKRCRKFTLPRKCVLGSCIITAIEFFTGCIVNKKMKLNVWDYSKLPFNFKGQVCLLYSFFWGLLTLPIALCCSYSGKKPKWLRKCCKKLKLG